MKLLQDISLGSNLAKLRKERHLSQYYIANQLQLLGRNMSRSQYSHIELGIANIRVSDIILIAKILNVDYNTIFDGLEPNESD